MQSQLHANELRAALKQLPPKVQQAIMKKAMRKALTPTRDTLRTAWRAAPYKGKPPHRQAIARMTNIDVRRKGAGPSAPIMGRVGVDYTGRKGMLQRVWHLLEGGFKRYHKGAKGAYQNYSAAGRDEKQAYKTYLSAQRKAVMSKTGLKPAQRGALLKAAAADARKQYPAYVGERTSRAQARSRSISAKNSSMPGAWRSKAIGKAMLASAMQTLRREALAAAGKALKGGTP